MKIRAVVLAIYLGVILALLAPEIVPHFVSAQTDCGYVGQPPCPTKPAKNNNPTSTRQISIPISTPTFTVTPTATQTFTPIPTTTPTFTLTSTETLTLALTPTQTSGMVAIPTKVQNIPSGQPTHPWDEMPFWRNLFGLTLFLGILFWLYQKQKSRQVTNTSTDTDKASARSSMRGDGLVFLHQGLPDQAFSPLGARAEEIKKLFDALKMLKEYKKKILEQLLKLEAALLGLEMAGVEQVGKISEAKKSGKKVDKNSYNGLMAEIAEVEREIQQLKDMLSELDNELADLLKKIKDLLQDQGVDYFMKP